MVKRKPDTEYGLDPACAAIPPIEASSKMAENFPWRFALRLSNLPKREPKNMAQRDFTIQNKLGIHARPAAQFVKMANRFQSDITVEKDGEEVDGKSIMGLMMLAAGHGSVIVVSAEGEDEEAALDAIADLIGRKFEED